MAERTAAELLENMRRAGAPADLMEHLHGPLPIAVMCFLLGTKGDDWRGWAETSEAALSVGTAKERSKGARELTRARILALLELKRHEPAEDLASVLADAARTGEITHDEAVSLATAVYISGGHAVRNNSGSMMYTLLTHPEHWKRLHREPDILSMAVEELFRYVPHRNGVGIPRIATEDVRTGGQLIRAGDVVYNSYLSANRDPAVFPGPDTLNFDREAAGHLSFGYGPHYCLAAMLARMQAEVMIASVLERFPQLHLAVPPEEVEFLRQGPIRGPRRLPVAW
jgi:cytochrome P450